MKYKKSILAVILIFAFSTLTAQTATEKWPQLGNFKDLLNKTFQPAEEGNFKPVKNSSENLVMAADALTSQTEPKELKNPRINETILVLKKKAKVLHELVNRKAPDAEIMRSFQDLHDVFNKILQLCETKK